MTTKTIQDRYSITDIPEAMFDAFIDDRVYDIHTAHPAHVEEFDGSKRTVNVRLGVRRDMKGASKKIAPLLEVPVVYPSSGDFGITWPIKKGDTGLVVFCESSIDQWLASSGGNVVNPRNTRMHSYSDGIFIPHIMQDFKASASDEINEDEVCISSKDAKIKMSSDGKTIIEAGETKFTLEKNGKFCIDTPSGEFLSSLVSSLEQISAVSGGAGAADIAKIKLMVCD